MVWPEALQLSNGQRVSILPWKGGGQPEYPRLCLYDDSAARQCPEIVDFWDDRNTFSPNQLRPSSQYVALFHCPDDATHFFEWPVRSFTAQKRCRVCHNWSQPKNIARHTSELKASQVSNETLPKTSSQTAPFPKHTVSIEAQNLLSDTVISGPQQCQVWQRNTTNGGYGLIARGGKTQSVHRVMYDLTHPDDPAGDLHVRHLCNNPACIRPDHLALNTHYQNTGNDRDQAGTNHAGEQHPRSRLTREQTMEIYNAPKYKVTSKVLAQKYGVSKSHIDAIRTDRSRVTETNGRDLQLKRRAEGRLQRPARAKKAKEQMTVAKVEEAWKTRGAHKVKLEETSGCLIWQGTVTNGYGKFTIGRDYAPYAHGAVAMIKTGRLKHSKIECAIHSCHNKLCCNPDHLSLGPLWMREIFNTISCSKEDVLDMITVLSETKGEIHPHFRSYRAWALSKGFAYNIFDTVVNARSYRQTAIREVGFDTLYRVHQPTILQIWDRLAAGDTGHDHLKTVAEELGQPVKLVKDVYFGMSAWRFVLEKERGVDPYEQHQSQLTPELWKWFQNKTAI
jgi:hypothetical protein